jgi:elongation factor Tu
MWRFLPIGDGVSYYLMTKHSSKVLDVSGGPAALSNGAPLQQWSPLAGANQRWKITRTADGFFILTASHSGKVADVSGGPASFQDGAPLIQWDNPSGSNQQWLLEPLRELALPVPVCH